MTTTFQPPPTYAEVILVDAVSQQAKFNPIWLKWFLDLAQVLSESGGGGGGINHNLLDSLQGGTTNEYYHLSAAIFNALMGTSGSITPSGIQLNGGRLKEAQGAAVTAANSLTLGTDGNYFQVAGATQINILDASSWTGGSVVTLKFNSNPTVKHNQAASGNFKSIMLAGAVDFAATASDTLTLRYDSTDTKWYEIGRAVI